MIEVEANGPVSEEQQLAAQVAHRMDQNVRRIKRQMEGLWVELAETLHHFRAGQMWRDLGFDTFEQWLSDPGVELERRWVYKLTDAYKFLVLEYGVPRERVEQLKISKVNEVLPAIRRGQVELEAALADVETLPRSELEIQYRGLHSSTPGSAEAATSTRVETDHEPEWATCPTCGSQYRRAAT